MHYKHEEMAKPKNITYERVFNEALSFFQNDKSKALAWWMGKQDYFNNQSPFEMVKKGNGMRVVKFLRKHG